MRQESIADPKRRRRCALPAHSKLRKVKGATGLSRRRIETAVGERASEPIPK